MASCLTDDLVLKDAKLRALAPAPVRDHLSVFHWIYKHKPLYRGHYDFIYHCDDFVSLANQPQNRFEDFIKSCLDRWPGSRLQVKFLPCSYVPQFVCAVYDPFGESLICTSSQKLQNKGPTRTTFLGTTRANTKRDLECVAESLTNWLIYSDS